jgi:hypothetical protein
MGMMGGQRRESYAPAGDRGPVGLPAASARAAAALHRSALLPALSQALPSGAPAPHRVVAGRRSNNAVIVAAQQVAGRVRQQQQQEVLGAAPSSVVATPPLLPARGARGSSGYGRTEPPLRGISTPTTLAQGRARSTLSDSANTLRAIASLDQAKGTMRGKQQSAEAGLLADALGLGPHAAPGGAGALNPTSRQRKKQQTPSALAPLLHDYGKVVPSDPQAAGHAH